MHKNFKDFHSRNLFHQDTYSNVNTEYRLLQPRRRLFGIPTTSPILASEDLTSESSDDNIFPNQDTGLITR